MAMTHRRELRPGITKGKADAKAYRWSQVPLVAERTLAILDAGGKVEVLPKEIGTQAASEVLSCSVRAVQDMCDRGLLEEGRDWRKLYLRGARGEYRIAQSAVLRLREV
jgi:hypothetical protein